MLKKYLIFILMFFSIFTCTVDAISRSNNNKYAGWRNGPSKSRNFFPIAVWLQQPKNAERYKKAGINTYIGLWKGPTEKQLHDLKKAGMKVICSQNETGLKHIDDSTIIGWMQVDEPDNARKIMGIIPARYGPPISPRKIFKKYKSLRENDPSRPVYLNLGQGVAWDGWIGRGIRTNHPEDYPEYIKGSDIVSFDIYPVVSNRKAVTGNLWYVARGVERLARWSHGRKIIWNAIECTRINNKDKKPTPVEVKSEVWMSIIHGSMGITYFVHEWKPRFREAALLSDPVMLNAVTAINKEIKKLAPVLNSPDVNKGVEVKSLNKKVPVAYMMKKYKKYIYLFTVGMRRGSTTAGYKMKGIRGYRRVEVLGENRFIKSRNGIFKDSFGPWEVHIYRVRVD